MNGLFRLDPQLPPSAYKTYMIHSPGRPATCEEAGCLAWRHGWVTAVDETSEVGQRQAYYLRHDRSRRAEERRTDAGLTEFTYEAGQHCFAQHTLPWEGRERFAERGGDFRGNPRGESYEHARADDWVDSFANHQQKLADRLKEG